MDTLLLKIRVTRYLSYGGTEDSYTFLTKKSDHIKEAEEFDRMVSEAEIDPETSYLTITNGKDVEFLRGNLVLAKNRLQGIKGGIKTYAVRWLETNQVEAIVQARSPEEAIKKIKNLECDDIETLTNGVPHPDSIEYAIVGD
ncbi:MAG: hypothetical protein WCP20_13075 [Desulfuromonadales bacterium]